MPTALDLEQNCESRNANTESFPSNQQPKTTKKICGRCHGDIHGQGKTTLKALGEYYHEECFTCQDCGVALKPKYFPYEISKNETILLCQYDYFRRHNLLCYVCDKPLRGLYYTAFGKRYDEEHFSCAICASPCGIKKCFMHEDKLYCKYHFLKYFSKRCSGCDYPISDQYIEFPKGDEVHCWHPECYGIHKYWHVNLSAETLGLPSFPTVKFKEENTDGDINPTPKELDRQMQAFNTIMSKTWSVLYRFEEETAACISDMFQYLTISDQLKGIEATALFVLKIECLFKAIGSFESYSTDKSSNKSQTHDSGAFEDNKIDLKYSKFPRNLSTKIMIYLQLLRKLSTESQDTNLNVSSFMSVITGLTHFLKLLTRYGFYCALEKNKVTRSATALVRFLREVEKNELYKKDPFSYIEVSINATDNCTACDKYIQDDCIQYHDSRWHLSCFSCNICKKKINYRDLGDTTYNKNLKHIICSRCSVDDPASVPGFKYVSKLAQLIFLLKIALVRSKAVMEVQMKSKGNKNISVDTRKSVSMQQTYIRTLNDIKRLKSRREYVRVVGNDKQEARKSVILETSEVDLNGHSSEKNRGLLIHTDPISTNTKIPHSNVFAETKTLTLDDISRIVAAEQARELRPNAFTYFKKLREDDDETVNVLSKPSGVYYSELSADDLVVVQYISLSVLASDKRIIPNSTIVNKLIPMSNKMEKSNPGSFWWKMKTMMNKEPKKQTTGKTFGTPLDVLSIKWGVESDLGVGPSKIRIPIIVDELISSLRQMDMSVEGIFRKNGNIKRLKILTSEIDDNPGKPPEFSKENAIQLSALLKKYIRELPDPLLTTVLYSLWINSAKLSSDFDKQRIISLVYSLLPVHNRNVLEVLLSFLCWTASFSHIENEVGSKMDIHNLSTVITPNILYMPSSSVPNVPQTEESRTYNDAFAHNEGETYFLAIEVVDYLITHNEEMGMVPKVLISLLKEIKMKGIDGYEMINKFVLEKLRNKDLDFSEFEVQRNVLMKHSTSVVTQGEVTR